MSDTTVILDPTDERVPIARARAPRPSTLDGPVGIVDISKARGDVFCDELERLITARHPGVEVVRFCNPFLWYADPRDLHDEVATRCTAVIQALAD